MTEEQLESMRNALEIQGSDGNWNHDRGMLGMYNGMEFMLSIAEDRSPVFREAPVEWLEDKKDDSEPVASEESE